MFNWPMKFRRTTTASRPARVAPGRAEPRVVARDVVRRHPPAGTSRRRAVGVIVSVLTAAMLASAPALAQPCGMQDLNQFGLYFAEAFGVSSDGAVVVGSVQGEMPGQFAFRWVDGEMEDLGTLGGTSSYAYAASADGSVVVGESHNGVLEILAFR